jgi:hypothetical protein
MVSGTAADGTLHPAVNLYFDSAIYTVRPAIAFNRLTASIEWELYLRGVIPAASLSRSENGGIVLRYSSPGGSTVRAVVSSTSIMRKNFCGFYAASCPMLRIRVS